MLPRIWLLSPLNLGLFIAAIWGSIAIHEFGHYLAGILAGQRMVAVGVGNRNPFLFKRLGGTVFYLGRPLWSGLALSVAEFLRESRLRSAVMIAGGPIINLLILGGSWIAWHQGLREPWVAAAFYASVVLLVCCLPYPIRSGNLYLRTDGMVLLQLLCGTGASDRRPGQNLATYGALAKFCSQLDAYEGTVAYTLYRALEEIGVGDLEAASESLDDPCLCDPRRGDCQRQLEQLTRNMLTLWSDPAQATSVVNAVMAQYERVEVTIAFRLNESEALLGLGQPATEPALLARDDAQRIRRPDLETVADCLLFLAAPPDDPIPACRAILARRGAAEPSSTAAYSIISETARLLVERGRHAEARLCFQQAAGLLQSLAAEILDLKTRERFVAKSAAPLRAAISAAPPEEPLFLPDVARPTRTRVMFNISRYEPRFVRFADAVYWMFCATSLGCLAGVLFALGSISGQFPTSFQDQDQSRWAHLTEDGRRVMQSAEWTARDFGQFEVTAGHLLLALIDDPTVAGVLTARAVDLDALFNEVSRQLPQGKYDANWSAVRISATVDETVRKASDTADSRDPGGLQILLALLRRSDDPLVSDLLRRGLLPEDLVSAPAASDRP